jgi:hypothetical protein
MIAEELGLGKSSVHTILTGHLEMKKGCAKIVRKLLTPEQKLRRNVGGMDGVGRVVAGR